MTTEPCSICGGSRDEHEAMNHEFNLDNQLITKDRSKPKAPQVQRIPTVIGGIDLDLRQILLQKGIIDNADFAALRNPDFGAARDRDPGEAPSTG